MTLIGTAQEAGLGMRQFERRFLQGFGISPKRFARVARFQTALDNKIAYPECPWIKIAHRLNYHDQMHMVRDFHELAGDSPSQIFTDIGDARPVAFVDVDARAGPGSTRRGSVSITH
jgi:AraC-like DNA-binding protein